MCNLHIVSYNIIYYIHEFLRNQTSPRTPRKFKHEFTFFVTNLSCYNFNYKLDRNTFEKIIKIRIR